MTIGDLKAFREEHGIPWSATLEEVVRLMETKDLDESALVPSFRELYDKVVREFVGDQGVMDELRRVLVKCGGTKADFEYMRMKNAVQRLEIDARSWTPSRGARTHRFEYRQPGLGAGALGVRQPVLVLVNVEHDETKHRTFLDAMEE